MAARDERREVDAVPQHLSEIVTIAVEEVAPNPRQPRQDFDPVALRALAESIRTAGLMQPIVVRPRMRPGPTQWELVAGERRWRAAQLLSMQTIPALVAHVDDRTSAEWALIENIQREDLNPVERATALQQLVEGFGLTHQELGERVGLDRTTITNLLRLRDLDSFTLDALRTRRLMQGHAKALLALDDINKRHHLAAAAIAGGWSVRELERRVQHALQQQQLSPASAVVPSSRQSSAHLADLERRLGEHLGTRVSISLGRKKGTGRVSIDFYTLDQFDGLLGRLGFRNE